MPVKFDDVVMLDEFLDDMNFFSESFPAAEIWDKFDLENLEDTFSGYFDFTEENANMQQPNCPNSNNGNITFHDCMWAGHCGSKEHPVDVRPLKTNIFNNFAKQTTQNPGRSLLLKTQQTLLNTAVSNAINAIESPPNSDDEEPKTKTDILKTLQKTISDVDDDLFEYFKDEDFLNDTIEGDGKDNIIRKISEGKIKIEFDDEEEEDGEEEDEDEEEDEEEQHEECVASTSSTPAKSQRQFNSDHCYHKDKNATMHNLGIETPSDSEEEIDVVTISEKQAALTPPPRMPCLLPNNPTTQDRRQIQRTMASAINSFGVKTLLPRGKSAVIPEPEVDSPTKRSVSDHRGVKRQRRRSPSSSPYKKRATATAYNQSSDSEQEPSEKRSMHNNMERQRRIDLRNAFEDLKTMVPEVRKRERAPKVVILREASVYCRKLENISYNMVDELDELKQKQKQLRARVSQLRLSLAHKHR